MNTSLQACFNKAAASYDGNSDIQQELGGKLIELLQPFIAGSKSMIDLGCGTGIVTEKLLKTISCSQAFGIDLANNFLKIANKRLATLPIKLYQANFNCLPLTNESVDHVFSNMALHWSDDFKLTLQEVFRVQKSQGIFALSLPIKGAFVELNQYGYRCNDFLSQAEVNIMLRESGYDMLTSCVETRVVKYNNILAALRSFKKSGTNFLKQPARRLQCNKRLIASSKDSATLTYVIYLMVLQKK